MLSLPGSYLGSIFFTMFEYVFPFLFSSLIIIRFNCILFLLSGASIVPYFQLIKFQQWILGFGIVPLERIPAIELHVRLR